MSDSDSDSYSDSDSHSHSYSHSEDDSSDSIDEQYINLYSDYRNTYPYRRFYRFNNYRDIYQKKQRLFERSILKLFKVNKYCDHSYKGIERLGIHTKSLKNIVDTDILTNSVKFYKFMEYIRKRNEFKIDSDTVVYMYDMSHMNTLSEYYINKFTKQVYNKAPCMNFLFKRGVEKLYKKLTLIDIGLSVCYLKRKFSSDVIFKIYTYYFKKLESKFIPESEFDRISYWNDNQKVIYKKLAPIYKVINNKKRTNKNEILNK